LPAADVGIVLETDRAVVVHVLRTRDTVDPTSLAAGARAYSLLPFGPLRSVSSPVTSAAIVVPR
jgi:hypothetical protein